jgi:hypothetical protein
MSISHSSWRLVAPSYLGRNRSGVLDMRGARSMSTCAVLPREHHSAIDNQDLTGDEEVPVGQPVAELPAHRQQDHLGRESESSEARRHPHRWPRTASALHQATLTATLRCVNATVPAGELLARRAQSDHERLRGLQALFGRRALMLSGSGNGISVWGGRPPTAVLSTFCS